MDTKIQFCFVQFKYIYTPESSEDVRILGNIDSLGKWQPNNAIKLIPIENSPNSWITKEKIKIPLNFNLEYKYLIFKNNILKTWEEISNNENRKITLTKKGIFTLLDKPKCFSTEITKEKKNTSEINSNDLIELNYDSDYEEKKSSKKNSEENTNDIADIDDNDEILMFSFYLPINIVYNNNQINYEITNDSLYNTMYKIFKEKNNIKWFGCLDEKKTISKIKEKDKEILKNNLEEKNMFLLDIDSEIYKNIIELINNYIEPDVYNISLDTTTIDFINLESLWESYKQFNNYIASIILNNLPKKNPIIFLNDYHFLLVPNELQIISNYDSDIFANLSLGIFLHNSFPPIDIYKNNYFREEILISMLKCKVIGFHTFDSSKNFLTCTKKFLNVNLLSTNKGDLAVNYLENNTLIRVKNVTPELDLIKQDINSDEFIRYYKDLENKYDKRNKQLIFIAFEENSFLLSVINILKGYQKFLENNNKNNNKYLFILCINNDINKNEENKEMMGMIEKLVEKIKINFGEDKIELYKEKINYIQKLALFAFSNCIIHTSKKESYSLGLYEFLLIKKIFFEKKNLDINDINQDIYIQNKDILNISFIVNELSRVNTSLGGVVKINSYDYISISKGFSSVSNYLNEELNTNKDNYLSIIKQDFIFSTKFSFNNWFFNFLKDIKNSNLSDENTFFICNEECTTQFKLKKLDKKFKKLDLKNISLNYEKAHNRLIFFDNEGTLPCDNNKPTDELIDLLKGLTKDKRNKIFIISQKGISQIYEYFKEVNNLGIGVEDGFKYIINNHDKKSNWIKLIKDYESGWIKKCVLIITPYTERYEGSFIDIKESSVVWYYSECEQDLGKNLASILNSELNSLINDYNLKIINGKGYIEIIPFGINKGYFISHILKKYIKSGRKPDFIMCIGDDNSDEKMFNYLNNKENEIKKYSNDATIYSITVGKKPSKAKYYVNNIRNVKEIINSFVKISEKTSSSISSSIIRKSTLNLKYNIDNEKNKEEKE